VSRRTSPTTRIKGRRVSLTPGAKMRFGSLVFVYTGSAESVAGRTFARLARPNVPTGAAGHAAFVRGFSDEMIMAILGPKPTQKCFRLAAYYLADLASRPAEPSRSPGGSSWSGIPPCTPGQLGLPDDPFNHCFWKEVRQHEVNGEAAKNSINQINRPSEDKSLALHPTRYLSKLSIKGLIKSATRSLCGDSGRPRYSLQFCKRSRFGQGLGQTLGI
jgi:hypothetical protein